MIAPAVIKKGRWKQSQLTHTKEILNYIWEIYWHILNFKGRLKQYVVVKHNGFTVDCENCWSEAGKKYLLEKHILVHHNGVTFDCHICQDKNNSKDGIDRHVKKEHERLRFEWHESCHDM